MRIFADLSSSPVDVPVLYDETGHVLSICKHSRSTKQNGVHDGPGQGYGRIFCAIAIDPETVNVNVMNPSLDADYGVYTFGPNFYGCPCRPVESANNSTVRLSTIQAVFYPQIYGL